MVKRRKGLLDEEKFLPPLPEQLPRGVSSLLGYGQGPGMQVFQEAADVGRGLFGATPIIEGGEGYRTGQALANIPPVAAGLGVIKAPTKVSQLTGVKPTSLTRLYHGGSTPNLSEVPKGGTFDGFFGSPNRTAALSHGSGQNYYADIPNDKILSNYSLNYEVPYKDSLKAFTKVTGIKETDPNFDAAWKAIVEDQSNKYAADADLFDVVLDDPGLIAQKKRGQMAKELGYQAIEMSDEHGTSYLMTPGVLLKYLRRRDEEGM